MGVREFEYTIVRIVSALEGRRVGNLERSN